MLIFSSAVTVVGLGIGFFYGWFYSLVITITIPLMFMGMGTFVYVVTKSSEVQRTSYSKAGGISEQLFESILTVFSLNGQTHEVNNYFKAIIPAKNTSIRYGFLAAIFMGIFYFIIFSEYGFGFWFGA